MIAICTTSGHFFPEWLAYCQDHAIPHKTVDCFATDIIEQLRGCRALLWHWPHESYRAQLFARQLIASVEEMGLVVFPGRDTCWHYDDKVGQKYLLEAIGAPLVPTHVFYDRAAALRWAETTTFPKVWKLRGGAGSQNVRLVRSRGEARRIIARCFGAGWSNARWHPLRQRIWAFRRDRTFRTFLEIGLGAGRVLFPKKNDTQRDYAYFQDFVPDMDHDIRIIVIGDRAFAIKRMVRDGDFRASGSGRIVYDRAEIPVACVDIAFRVTNALRSQCCAFDFVRRGEDWLIVEISYAFTPEAYRACPGYWTPSLDWRAEPVRPERFMLEDVLSRIGAPPAPADAAARAAAFRAETIAEAYLDVLRAGPPE